MKKKLASLAAVTVLLGTFSSVASADTWNNQPGFWNNPGSLAVYDTSNYANTVSRAVSGWNALASNVKLTLYRTTQPSYYQIRVASSAFPDSWLGATSITLQNNQKIDAETATEANWPYDEPYMFAWCNLNERSITTDYNLTYDQKTNVAGHEIGHALAAGHDTDKTALMYPGVEGSSAVLATTNERGQMVQKYGY